MQQETKKIQKGLYEYRNHTIQKLYDYPALDWRIFDKNGEWENSFKTLTQCKLWLDLHLAFRKGA
tara:strand:- start:864 stop:1058 length:195 start_codon:yes stop_codon:yes gene_type:complete